MLDKKEEVIFNHPELRTSRLSLRKVRSSDDELLFRLRSNEAVNKYLDRAPAKSVSDAQNHIAKLLDGYSKGNAYYWIIEKGDDNTSIGTICLWNIDRETKSAEIGYELLPHFHEKGYMREAVEAVLKLAADNLQISRVTGWMHKDNSASEKLLERVGFTRDLQEEKKNADLEEMRWMVIYSKEL